MVDYEEWEQSVEQEIRDDALWKLRVYRLALYSGDVGRSDAAQLACQAGYATLADQLRRATESISSNIAEGFSRFAARDRARFLEYALGSAREARDWYHKARAQLGTDEARMRLATLGHVIRILTTLISQSRPAARSPH